ncbi:MAG: molybdenum cofactor guanylyltransferase [Myxococcota bacterium]|nr:molybdenum cofactor guanylyltransferase [Myxococcota bacterium]
MRPDVAALILAGGKASRMGGVDKRELVVEGRTIFERQLEALAGFDILVSSPRDISGHRTVRDAISNGGPLAGIAAGLVATCTPWLLVLAGDMPYITSAVIGRLVSRTADDIDAVGIRLAGRPEPLVCVLRVSVFLPLVQARLERGDLKASRLLTEGEARVAWLDEHDARAFFNVNVATDL